MKIIRRVPSSKLRPSKKDWSQAVKAILIITYLCFSADWAYSQPKHDIEYRFKAVYLLNFLQFVEWPPSAYKDTDTNFTLGVLGEDPFGVVLDETVKGENIGGRPIVVRRFRSWGEARECQALFISSSEKEDVEKILHQIGDSSVLTVSDMEGFEDRGGGITFFLEQNKIRFTINIQTMKIAGLKVSSKLLRLAKIVDRS